MGLRTLRVFGNTGRRCLGMRGGPVHRGHTGECCGGAPAGNRGMLGVPVTALPSGGLHPACACRRVPSREAAETHPCRIHVWHCHGAPRTSLDSLRAVGAVQVGAAVVAEVVAGLYVDHRVSAHGALFFLACGHPPCSGSASYYSFWQVWRLRL